MLLHGRYGYRSWEWSAGLRGYLHPVLFAVLYKVFLSNNYMIAPVADLGSVTFIVGKEL